MNRWKTGEGINLDVLQFVLEHNPIKAVLVISNFSNPTGTVLSYERHLRRIRQGLKETVEATRRAILDCFPPGTTVTNPEGGFLLWVTLPQGHDTMELYFRALEENILIAPGCLFSRHEGFSNCMRINAASWSVRVDRAIRRLGAMLAAPMQV